uniref:outer membrane protein assembly factor BamB family protein n=1 Tax=Streptomyces sp. NRRL B-24572 TaxID=1962156 RepID=UPI0015C517D1
LVGDVVGFAETVSFRALDTKDGRALWSENVDPRQITTDGTSFYLSDGPYEGPGALHIRTLAPRTGKEAAPQIVVKGFDGSSSGTELLTASGGMLFAASRRGDHSTHPDVNETGWHLIAVNLLTGKEAWRQAYEWDGVRPWLSRVAGDRLILGKNSGDLESFIVQARDLRTGRRLWRRSIALKDSQSYKPGQLAVDERHVYIGGDRLRALRLTDGGTAWEYGSGSTYFGLPAVGQNDIVYAQEQRESPGLVGLLGKQGTVFWTEFPSGRTLTPDYLAAPVVGDKYVYAPVRGGLSAVEMLSNRSVWVFPTDASRYVVDKERARIIGAGATSVMAIPYA